MAEQFEQKKVTVDIDSDGTLIKLIVGKTKFFSE